MCSPVSHLSVAEVLKRDCGIMFFSGLMKMQQVEVAHTSPHSLQTNVSKKQTYTHDEEIEVGEPYRRTLQKCILLQTVQESEVHMLTLMECYKKLTALVMSQAPCS